MQISLYTSIIHLENVGTIIFNASNMKSMVVKGEYITKEDINKYINNQNNSEWIKILIDQMHSINSLTNLSKDEQIKMLEWEIHEADNQFSEFTLHINPTMDCNFNCWYCYENHLPNTCMTPEIAERTKLFIHNIITKELTQQLNLGFFGGEPLLEFNNVIKPIIKYASKECKRLNKRLLISFTSNGYLIDKEIIEFLKDFDVSFQITLDGGIESHNKIRFTKTDLSTFNKINENILLLLKNKIRVILRVNFTSKNERELNDLAEYINLQYSDFREYLVVDLQRVWQDRNSRDIDDPTEETANNIRTNLRKAGYVTPNNTTRNHISHPCYGDQSNYLLINYNGDLYGCTAREFTKTNSIGFLKEDGTPKYNELFTKRQQSKFSKEICTICRIAPLCGGGCRQKALENIGKSCLYGYDEPSMDQVIIKILEDQLT